jgi:uncharacterized membrane protein YedE/YeeE
MDELLPSWGPKRGGCDEVSSCSGGGRLLLTGLAAVIALLTASPAGAWGSNSAVFTRHCGQNQGSNANRPSPHSSQSVTVVLNGNCAGVVGSRMLRANGSLTAITWGNAVLAYTVGAIQGSYDYGCQSCNGSWLPAV